MEIRSYRAGHWVEDAVADVAAADSAAVLLGRDSLRDKRAYYRSPSVVACVAVSMVDALALEHAGYLEGLWKELHQAESYLLVLVRGVLVGFDSLDRLVFGQSEEKS